MSLPGIAYDADGRRLASVGDIDAAFVELAAAVNAVALHCKVVAGDNIPAELVAELEAAGIRVEIDPEVDPNRAYLVEEEAA